MFKNSLCGIYKEAAFIILHDSIQRIKVLQHISRQYFCDTGSLISESLSSQFVLPSMSTENPVKVDSVNALSKSQSTSAVIDKVRYGICGAFERQMCEILDSVEYAQAEITGVKCIKLPNGRIQYINEKKIEEMKSKEDLQTISGYLDSILEELNLHGTFQKLQNYIIETNESISKALIFSSSSKTSRKEISRLMTEKETFTKDYKEKEDEYKTLIQHLKHQRQELYQKNLMESNLISSEMKYEIQQMKIKFTATEKEILTDIEQIQKAIEKENRVNEELLMYLRNNIQLIEQNIDYWSQLHSTETSKIQKSIKVLINQRQRLQHELENLAKRYVLCEKVCIEDRFQKAQQARMDQIKDFHNNKALVIQKWWRYVCAMLMIGSYAPKKKGKKNKDKKKK